MTIPNATGFILLFGVILSPVYLMLFGWFFSKPREVRLPLIGTAVLVGLFVAVWMGLLGVQAAFSIFF